MKKFFVTLPIILLSAIILTGCSHSQKADTTFRLEESVLTVAVPFELSTETISEESLGDSARYVKKTLMKSATEKDMVVLITGGVYDKEKIERDFGIEFIPDLDGALKGAVGKIENVQRVEPLRAVTINGLRGREINGELKIKFKGASKLSPAVFRMVTFAKGSELWMVGVIRKNNDDTLETSNKIFKSITLK